MTTANQLLAERRRVSALIDFGLASGAHAAALEAVRSGASPESTVGAHVQAALEAGRTDELEEAFTRHGLNASAAFYSAGAGVPMQRPSTGPSDRPSSELEAADRLAAQIHGYRAKRGEGDLGDQVVAILQAQGGFRTESREEAADSVDSDAKRGEGDLGDRVVAALKERGGL